MSCSKFWALWTPRRFLFFVLFIVTLTVPLAALIGSSQRKWHHISDPIRYVVPDMSEFHPAAGLTLTGALMSFKPDEGKMYIEWRVGGTGDYARKDDVSNSSCPLYKAMPGLNGLDALSRHHVVFFDGQPVFNSSTVADHKNDTILSCGDYTTGGRQFIFGHPLDIGLDYGAQRARSNSYPYEEWTTSFRVCAWGQDKSQTKNERPPIASAGVLVTRVDGFLIRSKFSQIKSKTGGYGYVLSLTLERDPLARFFADCLFAITWILAVLAAIFAVLSTLWAYRRPDAPPPPVTINITPGTVAANGAWTPGSTRYEGELQHAAPEREAPKTSEALWVPVTIGGILIVIRSQYPGSPPLGTYIDYFGFYPSFCLTALTLLLGIAVSSRVVDTCLD